MQYCGFDFINSTTILRVICRIRERDTERGKSFREQQSRRDRRRQWQPTPVLLPGKSHGWRSLVGCSPWDCYELDMTEQLHFHFSLSDTGEGNGNPLQCSCLENPRDGGAWWAAVYGVAQSRTRLKRLSSSSSSSRVGDIGHRSDLHEDEKVWLSEIKRDGDHWGKIQEKSEAEAIM